MYMLKCLCLDYVYPTCDKYDFGNPSIKAGNHSNMFTTKAPDPTPLSVILSVAFNVTICILPVT